MFVFKGEKRTSWGEEGGRGDNIPYHSILTVFMRRAVIPNGVRGRDRY